MARNKQAIRQLSILHHLVSRYGVTVIQLATQFQTSRRTIERDLVALESAGFPLTDEFVNGEKRWKIMEGFQSKLPIPFSLAELLSLYFRRHILETFAATLLQTGY